LKLATYIGGLVGLALLVTLMIRADVGAIATTLGSAGGELAWLLPYRALYFLCYAAGWLVLLRPYDKDGRAGLGYLFWVTTIREAIDRLLPVASVGGSVVGIRLLHRRGLAAVPVSATVFVEIVLTLIVSYVFTAVGLIVLVGHGATDREYRNSVFVFLATLPVPIVTLALMRYGSPFRRLQRFLRPLIGESLSQDAASLDQELRACLSRRSSMFAAGSWQFAALLSGAFEIWFALRLFGHPVSVATAVALESMNQATRHVAFFVPAGLGVQEAGLIVFGQLLGINGELALALSMVKRMREVLWGVPSLLSWQWFEGRQLEKQLRNAP
jgi:putative membrane protein